MRYCMEKWRPIYDQNKYLDGITEKHTYNKRTLNVCKCMYKYGEMKAHLWEKYDVSICGKYKEEIKRL